MVDPKKMVCIGSIDRRVDFEWLDALAANDVTIEFSDRSTPSPPPRRNKNWMR